MYITSSVLLLGGIIVLALLYLSLVSLLERELRAAGVALGLALAGTSLYLIVGLGRFPYQNLAAYILLIVPILFLLAFFIPFGKTDQASDTPRIQIDERDIMFARWRLVPGSSEYESYYARWPERKQVDDRIRSAPGLFSPDSKLYHPFAVPAADASFAVIEFLREAVDGPKEANAVAVTPSEATRLVKGAGRSLRGL